MSLPVVADLQQLLRRLALEEDDQRRALARLEDGMRRFEDIERPAYEGWLRLELGPILARLEELSAELRSQHLIAERVKELVEREGLHPREALHQVRNTAPPSRVRAQGDWTREEIEARRRARLEQKRAQRKQARREHRSKDASAGRAEESRMAGTSSHDEPSRVRMVELYRALARRLHPDSPTVVRSLGPVRTQTIWVEVQAAYIARSLERMLALSAWLETAAESGADASATEGHGVDLTRVRLLSLAERHERLRAVRRSCRALDRRLTELASEPAWGFASAPARTRRRLKQAVARQLEDELAQGRVALQAVEDFLAAIGSPRPPRPTRGR